MRCWLACSFALTLSAPLAAAELALSVRIPTLSVAEYHRPYVAAWIEREDHGMAAPLAVWYAQNATKEGAGSKWLPDLRQWWRRGGRELSMPVDGVSGATRPAGEHRLGFAQGKPPLGQLAPGRYTLVVEAAREVGGREVLRLPFDWPGQAPQHLSVAGQSELGGIALDVTP